MDLPAADTSHCPWCGYPLKVEVGPAQVERECSACTYRSLQWFEGEEEAGSVIHSYTTISVNDAEKEMPSA